MPTNRLPRGRPLSSDATDRTIAPTAAARNALEGILGRLMLDHPSQQAFVMLGPLHRGGGANQVVARLGT